MSARPYKALFVTHDTGLYGAPRSLATFLNAYETTSAELMVNRRLLGTNDLDAIRSRFGSCIHRVREAWLPFARCFDQRPPYTLRLRARNALARLARGQLLAQLEGQRCDFIHLNSLALHPLVDERLPFILHVREIYDGSDPGALDAARRARALICIDEATYAPFRAAGIPGTVINNPFDMTDVDPEAGVRLREKWNAADKVVFALVGKLNENKGAKFMIESFLRAANPDAMLVLVGEGDRHYMEECRALAGTSPGVVFHGFESEIGAVYAASDYILRGEAYACIGRTIYEGLYSGCGVVVPGVAADGERMFEFERFRERVHFYAPRAAEELIRLFRTLARPARSVDGPKSNVGEFVAGFDRVIQEALAMRERDGVGVSRDGGQPAANSAP